MKFSRNTILSNNFKKDSDTYANDHMYESNDGWFQLSVATTNTENYDKVKTIIHQKGFMWPCFAGVISTEEEFKTIMQCILRKQLFNDNQTP